MKKLLTLILVTVALQSCSLTTLLPNYDYPSADITINIDLQPAWGPVGYDYAAYYYMPEINIYYDINRSLFYYQSNNRWIGVKYLPPSYRVYDLFKIYKVVINYDNPWKYNRNHRTQYKHYRDDRTQTTIRMSNDKRYNKSWENLRPWVDPDRRSNRKADYNTNKPNQQSKPTQPNMNKKPAQQTKPTQPSMDKKPNQSTKPSQPNTDKKPSKPTQPSTDKKPSDNKPSQPSTDKKPTQQTKPTQPSQPSTDKKPSQPSQPNDTRSSSSSSSSRGSYREAQGNDGVSSRGR